MFTTLEEAALYRPDTGSLVGRVYAARAVAESAVAVAEHRLVQGYLAAEGLPSDDRAVFDEAQEAIRDVVHGRRAPVFDMPVEVCRTAATMARALHLSDVDMPPYRSHDLALVQRCAHAGEFELAEVLTTASFDGPGMTSVVVVALESASRCAGL